MSFQRLIFPLLIIAAAGLLYTRYTSVRVESEPGGGIVSRQSIPYEKPPAELIRTAPQQQEPVEARDAAPELISSKAKPEINDIEVSIGKGFSPVHFKMAAMTHRLALSSQPPAMVKRLPQFRGKQQRYGMLVFQQSIAYPLALDAHLDGYRLYVDLNRNGDMSDDGEPLENSGAGVFASTLILPLEVVSQNRALLGDYELWLFTGNKERPPASLSYYARTQLQGKVQLPYGTFEAYVADNRIVDGDFTNDGISVDFNRNGKIELRKEFISPNRVMEINGYQFRLNVKP